MAEPKAWIFFQWPLQGPGQQSRTLLCIPEFAQLNIWIKHTFMYGDVWQGFVQFNLYPKVCLGSYLTLPFLQRVAKPHLQQ